MRVTWRPGNSCREMHNQNTTMLLLREKAVASFLLTRKVRGFPCPIVKVEERDEEQVFFCEHIDKIRNFVNFDC